MARRQQQQQPAAQNAGNVPAADASQLTDAQFLAWGNNQNPVGYQDAAVAYSQNPYTLPVNSLATGGAAVPYDQMSQQLVRRNPAQSLARNPGYDLANQELWSSLQDGAQNEWVHEVDDEELEQKAAIAKREAQSKRPPKQIPPFIQKLSSFLDESNDDLIKWSEDGNSFIVLDEDDFAKRLIPELFKHNKYASFVRQLNMYGFHKKVGLSDNSMRASEKKAKSPSEYYNPYFKRGRPELLWLIQKPKSEGASQKRKRGKSAEHEQGSDDETKPEHLLEDAHQGDSTASDRRGSTDLVTLPKSEYAALRKEVIALQRSQQQIAQVLSRMRDENQQYYQQAKAFQAQNERHENSINAILTFLATFYNRSLDGNTNMAGMFSIPNNQTQANVVDVGDYDIPTQASPRIQRATRRPLALLPAPENERITTESPVSANVSASPSQRLPDQTRRSHPLSNQFKYNASGSNVKALSSTPTPNVKQSPASPTLSQYPDADQSTDMMSVINDVNAKNVAGGSAQGSPKLDFNAALRHYENAGGQGPLTPQERDNILTVMANNSGAGASGANASNALISPVPPPLPSLEPYTATREQLDMLERQMQEQDSKLQNLNSRLQPLSPSGSLEPYYGNGSGDTSGFGPYNPNDSFDLNNFVNNDYFPEYDGLGNDMTFDIPATGNGAENSTAVEEDNGSLFGDAEEENGEDNAESTSGRVIGSVDTSSGVPSPANAEEDDNANAEGQLSSGQSGTQADEEPTGSTTRSKRRRLRK